MDQANKALCYAYRNPAPGNRKLKCWEIAQLVFKKDGTHPTPGAVFNAATTYLEEKETRGRKQGSRKTTKQEDKDLLKTFHRLRPPGHGIDSRAIHMKLPKKTRKKICPRTVRNRLAEKGFKPERKIQTSDPGPALCKRRLKFAKANQHRTPEGWKEELQIIGDIKEFTWYPKKLQPKFKRLRAPWTYMTKAEKKKPAFARPKRWFPKKDYKLVKKQKAFGFTTSNGQSLAFLVPKPWSTEGWAKLINTRVAPFLKKAFPGRARFQLLVDGENLLHGPAAKAAFAKHHIKVFPGWPHYSPDLNPQENVWKNAEVELRKLEKDNDTFEAWRKRIVPAISHYPSSEKLIPSMTNRMALCIERNGGMIGK